MSWTIDTDVVIPRDDHWALTVRCSSEAYFVTLSFLPSCKDDVSSLWSATG